MDIQYHIAVRHDIYNDGTAHSHPWDGTFVLDGFAVSQLVQHRSPDAARTYVNGVTEGTRLFNRGDVWPINVPVIAVQKLPSWNYHKAAQMVAILNEGVSK